MSYVRRSPLLAVIISIICTVATVTQVGATGGASVHKGHHPVTHHATLRVRPACLTAGGHHRKLHIAMRHGIRGVHYTFAMLPLFGGGKITGPSMGRHVADREGAITFRFPAPNHKADVGKWQVTATRKLSTKKFKLAALWHFRVRHGRCGR
jgi:hypothetical protein